MPLYKIIDSENEKKCSLKVVKIVLFQTYFFWKILTFFLLHTLMLCTILYVVCVEFIAAKSKSVLLKNPKNPHLSLCPPPTPISWLFGNKWANGGTPALFIHDNCLVTALFTYPQFKNFQRRCNENYHSILINSLRLHGTSRWLLQGGANAPPPPLA